MTIKGIDVSRWQGTIDWQAVADSGVKFAAIRCTVGDYYYDPMFDANWYAAKGAGIKRMPYHVVAWHKPAATQVAWFNGHFQGREPDLPIVLDVEKVQDRMPDEAMLDEVCRLVYPTWSKPIIYSGAWCWDNCIESTWWRNYDRLWVASYTNSLPLMPRNWSSWLFLQYTNSGTVPGISGNVDLDYFNGMDGDLDALSAAYQAELNGLREPAPISSQRDKAHQMEMMLRDFRARIDAVLGE